MRKASPRATSSIDIYEYDKIFKRTIERIESAREICEQNKQNTTIKISANMKKVVSSTCKGDIEYSVFTSQEAAETLRLYVADRRRRFGEIRDQELLFCSERNRLPRSQRGRKPLTSKELQIIIKEAARKARIKEWKNVTPYCLRKNFESVLRSLVTDGRRLDVKTQMFHGSYSNWEHGHPLRQEQNRRNAQRVWKTRIRIRE